MGILLPRPMPNFPSLPNGDYTDADKEMFRRWDATLPEVPRRRWFEFWKPHPNEALAAKWRNFRRDNPPYTLREPGAL